MCFRTLLMHFHTHSYNHGICSVILGKINLMNKQLSILILLLFPLFALSQSQPKEHSLPIQFINGLPYITLTLNGKGPYLFGFDSGMGGQMELDSTVARELNIVADGKTRVGDPSGKNSVPMEVMKVQN